VAIYTRPSVCALTFWPQGLYYCRGSTRRCPLQTVRFLDTYHRRPFLVSFWLMLYVSLDCPFWLLLRFSLTFISCQFDITPQFSKFVTIYHQQQKQMFRKHGVPQKPKMTRGSLWEFWNIWLNQESERSCTCVLGVLILIF
jgi:hypothetical protein